MITQARQQAAQLLDAVVKETLDPDAALHHWPRLSDPSLHVAYQALLHFSVDREGYHKTESYYADVQLQWLGELAATLATGQPLAYYQQVGYARTITHYWRPPRWWVALQNAWQKWPHRQRLR
jgi:hypothetical protein